MDSAILSNRLRFRKDGITHSEIISLDSLSIKLHALTRIAKQAVNDHPKDVDLFHTMSGIADLLQIACKQCSEIVADVAAMNAKRNLSN